MKVALIAPPYPLEETPTAPLGLCYVAAAFERAGAEVIILDYIVRKYTPEKLFSELSAFNPDVIGITSVTMNFIQATSIIQTAKKGFPEAITIMGGPHVSFDYEDTLKKYPEIDLIVIGEGEQTIAELVPSIKNKDAWGQINGLAYIENENLVVTPHRELIKNLDSLPFPSRNLLPMSRYLAMGFPISIITSRGCPNKCIFCQGHRMVGHKIRSRNPKIVVDEIENLLSYGFERVNFSDDFFTSNARRVREICSEINNRGMSFNWTVFARADSVDFELLTIMRETGCDTIFFGIESGNQEMLDRIKKKLKLDRVRKAVADSKAAGMIVFGSFIAGLPGETMETLMESDRFAKELDIIYGYHLLAPFPGTEVKEEIDKFDLKLLSNDWSDFDANRAIVRTSSLSPEEIEGFVNNYYLQNAKNTDLDTEKRYREGKLNPTEQMIYFGQKKLDIVFKLLSEDIIETAMPVPFLNHDTVPENKLAEQIAPRIERPMEFVLPSILHLVNKGYLKREIEGKEFVWRWA
jgi:radical SAM superfamily enzyme YgiQ (UPF0313 family)